MTTSFVMFSTYTVNHTTLKWTWTPRAVWNNDPKLRSFLILIVSAVFALLLGVTPSPNSRDFIRAWLLFAVKGRLQRLRCAKIFGTFGPFLLDLVAANDRWSRFSHSRITGILVDREIYRGRILQNIL